MSTPLEHVAALTIGTVESVSPTEIRVILDIDAPQATSLNTGVPVGFPRINSYILIPNEAGAVVALTTWLGVERSAFPKRIGLKDYGLIDLPFPLRKMALTPVGTLVATSDESGSRSYRLLRGVSVFPSVGDPALLPTPQQAAAIVTGEAEDRRVKIGTSPVAGNVSICIDPDKAFGRHLAVLGNTGSGKSCSVAGLIRWSIESAKSQCPTGLPGKPPFARFIILDPNGEYLDAFRDLDPPPRVFRAPPREKGIHPLTVPAWMWDSREWTAFAAAAPLTQRPMLLQALRDLRAGAAVAAPATARLIRLMTYYRRTLEATIADGSYMDFRGAMQTGALLRSLATDATEYTPAAGPDFKNELIHLEATATSVANSTSWTGANSSGYNAFPESSVRNVLSAVIGVLEKLPVVEYTAGPSEDAPVFFNVDELPDHLEKIASQPGGAQAAQFVATLVMRVKTMLASPILRPLVSGKDVTLDQWLQDFIGANNAENGQLAIIDLSLVPSDVLHVIIAVIARLIFEATQRYRNIHTNELPTVLILEEAHTFVQRGASAEDHIPSPMEMCRQTFERIAREGRKFGLGLVLSSQRPSELSPTVLAQCNTFLLHRIVNDRDQDLVHRLVPDTLTGLLNELPSLPARQAILLGWASPVPVLVEISELPFEHRPRSSDPAFWEAWTGSASRPIDWAEIARTWQSP